MNLADNRSSVVQAVDAGLLAGAVTLVWQRGNVLQVNEIGHRDVEAGLPMQRDTIFRIASMTKPVTVAAAMTLVEEGKLALRTRSPAGCPSWPTCGCSSTRTGPWTAPCPRNGRSPSTI